jgi:xylulokinase
VTTVLGIDLGTQQLKVLFYDYRARQTVAVESVPLELTKHDDGVAEQSAAWWTGGLRRALQRVSEDVRRSVAAIGVSGQQHGFVAVDKAGEVLIPVKLWCDTSTSAQCDAIMQAFGGRQACIDRVGNPILPGYTASKVRWLRDTRPRLYERLDAILLPHDYINYYLTGIRAMESGDASGTGFFDVRTRQWSDAMLEAVDPGRDLRKCLPEVSVDAGPVGELLPTAAEELGLPPGIPVSTGGGDNMMGAIGTGNVTPGKITMSLGTSGTVYAYSDEPVIDPDGEIAAFCSSTGGWLPLLCTMNCTVTTELMRGLLGADLDGFERHLRLSPPGAEGAITLPFFNGERTPNLPDARGCLVGLNSRNMRPEHFLRSAVEGATFALRYGIDRLAGLGVEGEEIILTGGGANSPAWRQIVADICSTPVTILEQNQGAAFGAALQALAMLDGAESGIDDICNEHLPRSEAACVEPSSSAVSTYEPAYRQYRQAVEAVASLYGLPQH